MTKPARHKIDAALAYPSDRRMIVSLEDYWDSLRGDGKLPLFRDIDMDVISDVRDSCFLLELRKDTLAPIFRFVGKALIEDSETDVTRMTIVDVPRQTLLAEITDLYLNVLAIDAPIAAQGEFTNRKGLTILYRGVLLPFSNNGRKIAYILGAINSKRKLSETTSAASRPDELDPGADTLPAAMLEDAVENARTDHEEADGGYQPAYDTYAPAVDDGSEIDTEAEAPEPQPLTAGNLRVALDECRNLAREVDANEWRSREALYDALAGAYTFYQESNSDPATLEDLFEEASLPYQDRAPFTPIVKLIFGAGYDKTRVSEYAATLSYAERRGQAPEAFKSFVEGHEGGIKGCVKAERAARRQERGDTGSKLDDALEVLRQAPAIAEVAGIDGHEDEFVLLLGRRSATASDAIEIVGLLDEKPGVVESILKRAAKRIAKLARGTK